MSAWSSWMICDVRLVMLICFGSWCCRACQTRRRGRTAQAPQVISCRAEKCLGQSLRRVVSLEVVVELGKRGVRQKLAL